MGIRLVYGLKTDDASFLDDFYPSRRLGQAAKAMGIDYAAYIHGESYDRTLGLCRGHVALLRGDLAIDLYARLESDGVHVVNGQKATALALDKLSSAAHFNSLGLRHPSTMAIEDRHTLETMHCPEPMAFPFIVKPRLGRMGRGVELIETPTQWAAFMASAAFKEEPYIAQEYLPHSHGRDVRFFFARFYSENHSDNPSYVVALRRSDGLVSNAHRGGIMEPFCPPPSLIADAQRIFCSSGLHYGSVDFLFSDNKGQSFAVCETNASPGFEALEKMSGLDVAGAILLSALGQEE